MMLQFTILRQTYSNPDNGYTVLQAQEYGKVSSFCAVGTFYNIRNNMEILAEGEWTNHIKYGQRFQVKSWQEVLPSTLEGIEKDLASDMIKGVGKKYAHLIVEYFKEETMDVIENHIERLREVPGIGKKRLKKIFDSWQSHYAIKHIMIFLQGFGVSTAYAVKIYKQYGEDSIAKVKENPYCLAEDIDGIGFRMADAIALNMGYDKDDERRCTAGLVFALEQLSLDGHVYAEREQLLVTANELLEVEKDTLEKILDTIIWKGKVIEDNNVIYLPVFYHAEENVAYKLATMAKMPARDVFVDIDYIQKKTGVTYDNIQEQAIYFATKEQITVLTGGPGTGKTTTVQGIIEAFGQKEKKVLLAAPTGRAAKRMSEATHLEAKTIHRLLEYTPKGGFLRNEINPLEGDVLIVDEVSMVDLLLMNALMKAVPPTMKVVFVGDVDQLPSVGAGNVLNDMIRTRKICVVRLKTIHRQAMQSRIITNAHAINEGRMPDMSNAAGTDFFFIRSDEDITHEIVRLVNERLPKAYGYKPSDIQVLCPMKKGAAGTELLNKQLQEAINPQRVTIERHGTCFRLGDKVMQIKNNYDKGVFNGDVGYITYIDKENDTVLVNFDGTTVSYGDSELNELTLAYACTIHKSQGSEFPIVVLPLINAHYVMLQRNLLYTGVTRAKRICVIIGEEKAVGAAVRNIKMRKRNTLLTERICKLAEM